MIDLPPTTLLQRYQRLIEISRDLASTLDLDTLLYRIVKAAADLSLAEEASILLYDEAKKELRFQAATNLDNPTIRGLSVPVDHSVAGWIVTNREALIISDVKNDQRHFGHINRVADIATQSILGVPLINKDKVIGALEVINKCQGQFDTDDQELLMILGAQAAVAIENARLFQQSDLISEFVHELRTPLASINTAAHLLDNPKVGDGQKGQLILAIQTETTRLSELATSFLDIARLESGRTQLQIQKCDLVNLLSECASLMQTQAQEMDIDLKAILPSESPAFQGDPDKIKQTILNLLSNAIKYNRPGGEIILAAENRTEEVIITVKDSGIGIPEEHLPRLFTKFYRVPGSDQYAQGTGLGLTIVKRIVEAHGGEICVASLQGPVTSQFSIKKPPGTKAGGFGLYGKIRQIP
jgi:signal transduction histidine kinase